MSRPMTSLVAVALTALLLLTEAGSGAAATGPVATGAGVRTGASADPSTSGISGRVVDTRGRPVPGVWIRLTTIVGSTSPPAASYDRPAAVTDANGRYAVRGLTAGIHRVVFEPRDNRHADRVWPGRTRDLESEAVDIVLAAGSVTNGVDQVLPVGGAVTGVFDVSSPAYARDVTTMLYRRGPQRWTERATRPLVDGRYVFGGLDDGAYRVCFVRSGSVVQVCVGGPGFGAAATIAVTAGRVTRADYRTALPGSISGRLTSVAREPEPHISDGERVVDIYRRTPTGYEIAGSDVADEYGDYGVGDLPAGAYRVGFRSDFAQEFWPDAGSVEEARDVLVTSETSTVVDATLDVGAEISGTFLDLDGDGGSDGVTAYRRAPDGRWRQVSAGIEAVPDGYRVTGLRPGTYRLGFGADPQWFARSVPVFWPDSPTLAGAGDIVVGTLADRVTAKDVDVDQGSVLVGSVRAFGAGIHTRGEVVAYRQVGRTWVEERRDRSTPRLNDRFSLAGLPAGTYRVGFEDDLDFFAPGFHGPGAPRRLADARSIVLGPDQLLDGIDIALVGQVRQVGPARVVGRTRVGRTLRLVTGVWSPTGTRLSFQWYSGGRPVKGARGTTYRLRPRDRGRRMSVVVTGSRGTGWVPHSSRTPSTKVVRRR